MSRQRYHTRCISYDSPARIDWRVRVRPRARLVHDHVFGTDAWYMYYENTCAMDCVLFSWGGIIGGLIMVDGPRWNAITASEPDGDVENTRPYGWHTFAAKPRRHIRTFVEVIACGLQYSPALVFSYALRRFEV